MDSQSIQDIANVLSQGQSSGLSTSTPVSSNMPTPTPAGLNGNVSSGSNLLSQLQQNTAPKQTQPTNNGGFWGDLTRLAPTIGSIALPTIADLVTGGLAAPADIALAGIGGGLGKVAENSIQGKNPLQMNDLTNAAMGAAGQAGGELLGKGLGVAGKFLTKAGTDAGTQVATDSADKALLDEATATKNNFGGINDGVQKANNLQDNQTLMKSFGRNPSSPEEMAQVAQGGNLINQVDNEALSRGNPIKSNSLLSSKNIVNLSPQEQQALVDSGIVQNGSFSQLPDTITPQQANDFAQSLGAQQRESRALMENARTTSPKDFTPLKNEYNQVSQLYNKAKEVAGTPEVNATIAARTVTPEEKAALVEQYGQKQADYVEKQINNAKTHADLVAAKRPFAEMGNLSNGAIKDEQAVATPRGLARVKQSVGNVANNPSKLINPKTIAELAGGYETVTNHPTVGLPLLALSMLGGNAGALNGAGDLLSSLGGNATADTLASRALGTIPGAVGATIGTSPNTVTQGGVSTNMNPNLQNSLLARVLNQDLSAGNEVLSGVTTPGLTTQASQLPALIDMATKAVAAEKAAQQMGTLAGQAGVGQGPIMGLLSQLGQTLTGGPASLLNNTLGQQEAQASQTMQAAGVSPSQITMPNMEQNQQTAQQTLNGIRQLIGALGGGQANQLGQAAGILGQ